MKDLLAIDRAICKHYHRAYVRNYSEINKAMKMERIADSAKIGDRINQASKNIKNKKFKKRGL